MLRLCHISRVKKFQRFATTSGDGFSRVREGRLRPKKSLDDHEELSERNRFDINYENTKTAAHAAKEYFDELYEERFGLDWLNYRCALLSPLKKVAVVTDRNENLIDTLESIGAVDIMQHFCQRARVLYEIDEQNLELLNKALYGESRAELAAEDQSLGDADLLNKINRLELALAQLNSAIDFAQNLSIYATGPENFHPLPRAVKVNQNLKDFYSSDLADVFTALCHCPPADSNVLFLNSESTMIPLTFQGSEDSLLTVNLNDRGVGQGLMQKTKQHFLEAESRIELRSEAMAVEADADQDDEYFDDQMHELEMFAYNSILIDVPSTTDRSSMNDLSAANVFSPINTFTRQTLPTTQKKLLKKAIQLCRPGGHVTYTSCTMSHLQNEYCVQSAVKELLMDYQITVRSIPLHLISMALPEISTYKHSKLGQLVVPRLGQNYGPRYICKLQIE